MSCRRYEEEIYADLQYKHGTGEDFRAPRQIKEQKWHNKFPISNQECMVVVFNVFSFKIYFN